MDMVTYVAAVNKAVALSGSSGGGGSILPELNEDNVLVFSNNNIPTLDEDGVLIF